MRSILPVAIAVLLGGVGLAAGEESGQRVSAGALELRGPAALDAGARRPVTITAAGLDRAPELVVNVGTLSPPRREGDRWRYDFAPPPTRQPYLVIIAGRDGGGAADWLAIPAHGRAGLDLRSEPHAEVVVEVGDQQYGPVRTDAAGRARLRVSVPPGIEVARTIATDSLGNVRHGSLPLSPPPFDRLLLLCPIDDDRALAVAPLPTGEPGEVTLEAEAEPGTVAAIEPVGPATYAVIIDAPDSAAGGDLMTARIRIHGDPISQASCSAPIATELPRGLRLSVSGDRWTAGGGAVEVVVEPVHSGHLPRRIVDIQLDAATGSLEQVEMIEGGRLRARWRLPDQLEGRTRATLTAGAEGVPGQTLDMALVPAPPARIDAQLERGLRADGQRTAVRLAIYDRFGNPVAAPVSVTAARGRIEEVAGDPAMVYYATPRLPGGGRDVLHIRAGPAEQMIEVPLASPPPRLELSAALGYHSNLAKIEGGSFAVIAGRGLLLGGHELGVALEAGYLRSRDRRATGDAEVETAADLMPVLARAWYARPLTGRLELRAGGGVGLVAGRIEATTPGASARASGAWPAALGFVSAGYSIGPGRLAAELGWLHATVDEDGIRGNPGGLRISVGYRYSL